MTKSILALLFVGAGLVACDRVDSPAYQERQNQHAPIDLGRDLVLTGPLADCKAYEVYSFEHTNPTVVRCPNSTTLTDQAAGKTRLRVITVDGVQYQQVPDQAASDVSR